MRERIRNLSLLLILSLPLLLPHAAAADCRKTSTGLTPLTEMEDSLYQEKEGGLYPHGNTPPDEIQAAGVEIAKQIQPRDIEGRPDDENGKIVFLSIGMSLTSMEFEAFMNLAYNDPLKNTKVETVNGAIAGVSASAIANRESDLYWDAVDRRLNSSGFGSEQVQVVWLKETNRPERFFPRSAEVLQEDLKAIVQRLKERFPNLQIVYLSSRSYGGYGEGGLNPEPYAYETGFAVKWLIQSQIDGDPDLNYDASRGPVKAPLLRWGPYLWADGVNPRKEDHLSWQCSDFADDGIHPSESGQMKVARLLLHFVQTDPTARVWYLSEDAQDEEIEPLVFATPFPTEWLIALIASAVVAVVILIRFVRNRETDEEEDR